MMKTEFVTKNVIRKREYKIRGKKSGLKKSNTFSKKIFGNVSFKIKF